MRRFVRRCAALAPGLVVATGCSLLTSLDGLTGDAADGAVAVDANAGDAGDGGVADANGGDAAGDAPLTGDAARFCLSQTTPFTFCDDFDAPDAAFGTAWTSVQILQPGSVVAADSTTSVSPPASAHFHVAATDAGAGTTAAQADLYELLAVPAVSTVTVDFDALLPYRTDRTEDVFDMTIKSGAASWEPSFLVSTGGDQLREEYYDANDGGYASFFASTSRPFATAVWSHLQLRFRLGATSTATVTYGPDVVLQRPLQGPANGGTVTLATGLVFETPPRGAQDFNIDNFIVRVE